MIKNLTVVGLFIILCSFAYASLTNGLYSYNHLDSNYSALYGDTDLTPVNTPTFQDGFINDGLYLTDASSEYAYVNNPDKLGTLDNFTTNFWFNTTSTDGDMVLSYGVTVSDRQYYGIYLTTTNRIQIVVNDGTTNIKRCETPTVTIKDANWHMATVVEKGTGGTKIYVDGDEKTLSCDIGNLFAETRFNSGAYDDVNGTMNKIVIGGRWTDSTLSLPYDQMLDEIGIWNRSLTDTEITELYITKSQYPFINTSNPLEINVTYPVFNSSHNGSIKEPIALGNNEIGDAVIIELLSSRPLSWCDINQSEFFPLQLNTDDFYFYTQPTVTPLPMGNYTWFINCTDVIGDTWNFTTGWYRYDIVNPIININVPVNMATYQTTEIPINITYYDFWLWQTNTTVTDSFNNVIFNDYSGLLGGDTDTYIVSDLLTNLTNGTYFLLAEASDTHTKKEFKETPKISERNLPDNKKATKYELKNVDLEFKHDDDVSINSYKDKDRIRQEFITTDNNKNKDKRMVITSTEPIHFLHNSVYPCHIITSNYWYDCVGMPNPKVSVIDSYNVEILYSNSKNSFITESLGGINYINQTIQFDVRISGSGTGDNVTNVFEIPDEITIKFGNENIIFGFLLFMFLFIMSMITRNYTVFGFAILSGLVYVIAIITLSDLWGMYKIIVMGLYVFIMYVGASILRLR